MKNLRQSFIIGCEEYNAWHMSWFHENPNPQTRSIEHIIHTSENGYQPSLLRVFQKYDISPGSIRKALELGCGAGSMTHALLRVCPAIHILHAVDYGKVLQMEILNQQVVFPIIGLISTVIEQPPIIETTYDLIVCCAMSSHHGLNNWQLHILAGRLGQTGQLLTLGDNGSLEQDNYFRKTFTTKHNGNNDYDAVLWTKK